MPLLHCYDITPLAWLVQLPSIFPPPPPHRDKGTAGAGTDLEIVYLQQRLIYLANLFVNRPAQPYSGEQSITPGVKSLEDVSGE